MKGGQHMTEKPINETENPNQPALIPTPSNNRKWIILLVALVVIGFSTAFLLIGYILANKNKPAPVPAEATPSPSVTVIPTTPQVVPTSIEVTIKPTLPPNPKGNTYRSDKLHLAFYYASTVNGSDETFTVSETGNKVFVYAKGTAKESGQSVESFTKDPNQTLEQAITKQFLAGIASNTCFVTKLDSKQAGIETAIIDYPVPTDATEPFFTYGEACPVDYSKTNGMRYFYYDPQFPDRYFFFDIGQYGIPAYNDKADVSWQDTFSVSLGGV